MQRCILFSIMAVTIALASTREDVRTGGFGRHYSMDGMTSATGLLWIIDDMVSNIACARLCLRTEECQSFFYNSRTLECQGHASVIRVTSTSSRDDNVYYENTVLSAVTATPSPSASPPIHLETGHMSVDVFIGNPMSWYDAEIFCHSRTQGLLRLDSEDKLSTILTILALYPATMGRDVYVAGYAEDSYNDVFWDSGRRDFWKLREEQPFVRYVVMINSGQEELILHESPRDEHIFVCETE